MTYDHARALEASIRRYHAGILRDLRTVETPNLTIRENNRATRGNADYFVRHCREALERYRDAVEKRGATQDALRAATGELERGLKREAWRDARREAREALEALPSFFVTPLGRHTIDCEECAATIRVKRGGNTTLCMDCQFPP